ncbi:MAG TPA: hypothetical protein VGC90_02010 [Candidatus Limnocylindrales bacterium]|jgi:hypothetical protein
MTHPDQVPPSTTETHREPHGGGGPHAATTDPAAGHATAHDVEPLGPVDIEAWAAGVLGIALGLIVAVCFVFATAATTR